MPWHVTTDIDEFEDAAGGFLLADPVRNSVLLTVMASLRTSGATAYGDAAPLFGWYESVEVEAALLRTPPMPLLVSDAPEHAMRELAGTELAEEVPGLTGPSESIETFAEAWHARGEKATLASRRRLYRLAELVSPSRPVPGGARLVTDADRDLLIEWFSAFGPEVGEPVLNAPRAVDRRLVNGELLLWEHDGVPVSMAGTTTPIAGVARVAPVFTPAPFRGCGYAGAVTAAVSRRTLDAGHEVILFTNLANPTSNALYQRLGFVGIGQFSMLELA